MTDAGTIAIEDIYIYIYIPRHRKRPNSVWNSSPRFLACFPRAVPRQCKSRPEALASGPQVNREVIPDPLIQEVVHPLEQRPVLSAQRNKNVENKKKGGGARPILTTEAAHQKRQQKEGQEGEEYGWF